MGKKKPLESEVVRIVSLAPYQIMSYECALKRGKYDKCDERFGKFFGFEDVSIVGRQEVELVRFNRKTTLYEILDWAGDQLLMRAKHLLAIGIQYPELQYEAPIIALGSMAPPFMLGLASHKRRWRELKLVHMNERFRKRTLFGILRS